MQKGDESSFHFGRSSSFSENAHNSSTAWYILFQICILMYFIIAQPLACGDEASASIVLASQALLVKMFIPLEPRGAFGSNFEYLQKLTVLPPLFTKYNCRYSIKVR